MAENETQEERQSRILSTIRAQRGIQDMLGGSIVFGLFRGKPADYAQSDEEIARAFFVEADPATGRVPNRWFGDVRRDRTQLNAAIALLEEYKLLSKYPDGKYIYRTLD